MEDKDPDKKNSTHKNSSQKASEKTSKSTKKKGIPNSGTDVFLNKPLEKNVDIKTKKDPKDNYWEQGDLFEVGKSINHLASNKDGEKPLHKKTVNKNTSDTKKSTTSNKVTAAKKPAGTKKVAATKKTTSTKKSTGTKKTVTKKDTTNKTKETTPKKASSLKKAPSTKTHKTSVNTTDHSKKKLPKSEKETTGRGKSNSDNKKPSIAKTSTVNSKTKKKESLKNGDKNAGPRTSGKAQQKNSTKTLAKANTQVNKIDTSKVHSQKSHFIFIFLLSLSVVLILIIGILLKSYLNQKDNSDYITESESQVSFSSLQNNSASYDFDNELSTAVEIIKPTVSDSESNSSYEFLIEKGMSAKTVASLIGDSGYFDESTVLQYFIDNNISQKINVGRYYLIPSMSLSEIADNITIKDHFTMTIYPGMRLSQIDSILSKRNLCDEGEFIEECTALCNEYGLSFVEGWFAPGEYYINRNLNVKELCETMYFSMLNELSPFLSDIAQSKYSIEDTLIIASLIQAETNSVEQMPLISEVIHNRLKSDMPLGINATTCYELGVFTPDIDQSVYDEITDFNTRRKKGLVPSAISAISSDALNAAVHPSVGDYLYYNHTKDGTMLMAKTYEQHLKNVEGNN
jgi:UPF0755 protein